VVWLVCFCLSVCSSGDISQKTGVTKEMSMNKSESVNYHRYGDMQASSSLRSAGAVTGEIIWQAASDSASGAAPIHLAIRDDLLVVGYGGYIEGRRRSDGEFRWGCEVAPNIDFDMNEKGIATLDETGFYNLVGYDGRPVEEVRLNFMVDDPYLVYADIEATEARYICYSLGKADLTPGEEPPPPYLVYARYGLNPRELIWTFHEEGVYLGACLSADEETVYLATPETIYVFPAGATSDMELARHRFGRHLSFSLDHEGDLLTFFETEEGRFLKKVRPDGAEMWQAAIPPGGEVRQPPASSVGGNVYLAAGSKIVIIKDGEVVREYESGAGNERIHISVLADNSVLVAAGTMLQHLGPDGEVLLNRKMPGELTCRPIMDNAGRVYVGGSAGLLCLE